MYRQKEKAKVNIKEKWAKVKGEINAATCCSM
jgi:hypothetical protein